MPRSARTVCRPHFGTSAPAEVVKFQCALFGWGFVTPDPRAGTIALLAEGREVATCVPPVEGHHGTLGGCYPAFLVPELSKAAEKASELGGKILARPGGRDGESAVVLAPTGEIFALAATREGDDAGGPDVWLEVVTPDPRAAGRFYQGLFGWETRPGASSHPLLVSAGSPFAGLAKLHDEYEDTAFLSATGRTSAAVHGIPPHWMIYFRVDDLGDALARVQFLGGRVVVTHEASPDLLPAALIQDPAGNFSSLVLRA